MIDGSKNVFVGQLSFEYQSPHVIKRRNNQCENCCCSFQTLVFSLEPDEDPLGVLLMIDFYALQSEQFSFLTRLFEEWEVRHLILSLKRYHIVKKFIFLSDSIYHPMNFCERKIQIG